MFEVEVKFRLTPEMFSEIRNKLNSIGARFLEDVLEIDHYLAHPCRDFAKTDEALRIRIIAKNSDRHAVLTYKGPRLGGEGKTREEISVEILDPESMLLLFERLGFRKVAEIKKRRTVYTYENFTIVLDDVEGLGKFVEIETATDSRELVDKCVSEILSFAENSLGLSRDLIEPRTYLELMIAASR